MSTHILNKTGAASKKKLWSGEFGTDGYYVATLEEHGNEKVIGNDEREQVQEGEG